MLTEGTMPETNDFTDIMSQWTQLFMRRSMRDFHEFMRNWGLSMPQVTTIFRLHYRGGCGVSDVAQHLGVSNAAASQMLDRLEQHELVDRVAHPADRRVRMVQLTQRGHSLVEQGVAARMQWISELTRMFSAEQQQMIMTALAALTDAARQMEQEPQKEKE